MKIEVGTKVKIVDGYFGEYNGRIATVTDVMEGRIMAATKEGLSEHSRDGDDFHYCFTDREYEPISTLTIEPGKYYRTRDGRKVGPMVQWTIDANHPFEVTNEYGTDLGRSLWSESGRNDECSDLDLIAEWTEDETGTLAELDVKPGDVVENENGFRYKLTLNEVGEWCDADDEGELISNAKWRIISRAPDTPMRCAECDCEKSGDDCNWIASYTDETFFGLSANRFTTEELQHIAEHVAAELSKRIKPEPVRETVTLYAGHVDPDCDPMPIGTIDLENGKPDLDSIKMEEM